MRQLALRVQASVLVLCAVLAPCLVSGCGPSEPLPDHLGLFAVIGKEVHELPRHEGDPSSYEGFWSLFSASDTVLAGFPDYLILYDPKFSPGDLHLANLTPDWFGGKFHLNTQEMPLKIEPLEKPAGMYRLRTQLPFSVGGYFVIVSAGPTSTGADGYRAAFCPKCNVDTQRAAMQKIKDDEAAKIKAAIRPSKEVARSRIVYQYMQETPNHHGQALTWNVMVTDTNLSWAGFSSGSIGYWQLESVSLARDNGPWGPRLCLVLPPRQTDCNNALQAMTPDEEQKLEAIGKAAKDALAAWKAKYPNGLPYTEPQGGPR
jgi:hypothetical protein